MRTTSTPARRDRRRLLTALAVGAVLSPLVAAGQAAAAPAIELRDIREFACPPGQVPDAGFQDVNANRLEIDCLAGYEITSGVTATRYDPAGPVSRAQMAVFVANTAAYAGLQLNTEDAGFTDIAGLPELFRDAINGLANAGIVNGKMPTAFAPGDPVSRGQMATFLTGLQAEVEPAYPASEQDNFTDDNGTTHEARINQLAAAGVVQGTAAGTYSPGASVSRQQMAAFLTRYLDDQIEAGPIGGKYERDNEVLFFERAQPTTQFVSDDAEGVDDTGDNRTYRVNDLQPGVEYRVTLVQTSTFMPGPDGTSRFTDSDGDELAEVGTYTADIIQINGNPVPRAQDGAASTTTAMPVDGTITFTIDGQQPEESVRPVLYTNGGRSPRLELATDDRPVEIFALGATANYVARTPGDP